MVSPAPAPPPEPLRAPRRWPRRLALSGAVFVLTVLALELAARLLLPPPTVNTDMVADRRIGFRMPPGLDLTARDEEGRYPFRLTSLGFRGPELPDPDEPPFAGERVLLVGDSFLNAWAVREERWVGTSLRAALEQRGIASQAHALCSKDIGTAQELLLLREYAARVRPTRVVLFLYTGNDVLNNALELAGHSIVSPGDWFRPYLVPNTTGQLEERFALPRVAALRASQLFAWGEALWLRGRDRNELMGRLSGRKFQTTAERQRRHLSPEAHHDVFLAPEPDGEWDAAWRTTEALLRAFRSEVEALGARFLVVVIPHLQQVERGAISYGHDAGGARYDTPRLQAMLDWDLPERRLEGFFHAESIEHVQLLGALRGATRARKVSHYVPDGHLGGLGHELMAEAIARHLAGPAEDCYAPAGEHEPHGPVDLPELYPERPLTLDFVAQRHSALFQSGWKTWQLADAKKGGGWLFVERGILVVPGREEVRLRGEVLTTCPLPVTLRVTAMLDLSKPWLETRLDQAGPFELTFRLGDCPADETWWPIALEASVASPGDDEGRVLVTGLEVR